MKDLEKILEYQKVDIDLRRIYDKIEKSDDYKKMELAKAEFNNDRKAGIHCEEQAQLLVSTQEEFAAQRAALTEELERLILIVENNEDDEAIEGNIEQLEDIRKRLFDFEKKVNETQNKMEGVVNNYKEANEAGRKHKQAYMTAKNKIEKLKEENNDKIEELTKKLSDMEREIDPSAMEIYRSVTAEGKYPAFVEAYHNTEDDMYSCRGCGIALSQKRKSELLEDGACRCETCRRIIYKN